MVKIPFKVLGKTWVLRLLDKKQYKRKNGRDSVGVTKVHKRIIDLSPSGMDIETIRHEVLHAFLGECCTYTADLTIDAFEEICCELMAKRGREILDLADELLAKMASPPSQ